MRTLPTTLRDHLIETDKAGTPDELFRLFDKFVGRFDIDFSSYTILSKQLKSVALDAGIIRENFPEEWVRHYKQARFAEIDPIIDQVRRRSEPFHWFDLERTVKLTPKQRLFLKELRRIGVTDGIAVPIFGPMGTMAFFGFARTGGALDLMSQEFTILQIACQRTHSRYLELTEDSASRKQVSLSSRETEILSLVAAGLSNNNIAERLGITENTVDTILRRAFRKLDARNRITAVLKGIGTGLIMPPLDSQFP